MPRNKRLDRRYVAHVAGILRPIIKERFGGNTTAFANAIDVSQSQMSQIMRPGGGDRGIGVVVLIAIRDYLRDCTLDELLGLDPPELVRVSRVEAVIARAIELRLPPKEPENAKTDPFAGPPAGRRSVRKRSD